MNRHLIGTAATSLAIVFLGAAMAQQPSRSIRWTKTYVVEWNEPAMYYGAKTGVIDPGTDCPNGTNPEVDWIKNPAYLNTHNPPISTARETKSNRRRLI